MRLDAKKRGLRANGRLSKADGDGQELSDEELKRLRADTADGQGAAKADGFDDDDDDQDDVDKGDIPEAKEVSDSDLDADGTVGAEETEKADGDDDDDDDAEEMTVDKTRKSRRVSAEDTLHKAIVKLSRRVDASDPEVRKDALFAKSKVAQLTDDESSELLNLIKGRRPGGSLRARSVGTMSKSAMREIQGSDILRESMGAVAQSHGVLADEIESFRKSTEGTQMLMGRAMAELGKQVIALREENRSQRAELAKGLRLPARAPKAVGLGFVEKGAEEGSKRGDFDGVYSGLQELYRKGGKANPDRAELQKALFDLTYTGKVSDTARSLLKTSGTSF